MIDWPYYVSVKNSAGVHTYGHENEQSALDAARHAHGWSAALSDAG